MEEIGDRLRAAREARGITLETAEAETRIRRKYLEALEEGREVDIPGEVYLKGFLRTYANFIGLDGTDLVSEYKEQADRSRRERAAADRHSAGERVRARRNGAGSPSNATPPEDPPKPTIAPRPHVVRGPGFNARPVLMLLLLAVLVAAVSYLGWLIALQLGETVEPPAAGPTTGSPADPAGPNPGGSPPPAPPADPPAQPQVTMSRGSGEDVIFTVSAPEFTVRFEFDGERVWMEAVVDGAVAFSGTPAAPIQFTGSQMRIRVGHMNDVNLEVAGQRFENPLQKGPYWLLFKGQ